jgi:hypothetical protein
VISGSDKAAAMIVLTFAGVLLLPNTHQFSQNLLPVWKTIFAAVLFGLATIAMLVSRTDVFLYYNF